MDSTTVPPSSASSQPEDQMHQPTDIQTLFRLLAALANGVPRQEAVRHLARYLGADDLLIFLPDPEIGILLPAPGLLQTLPRGRHWQAFLASCSTEHPTHAILPFPDATTMIAVVGLVGENSTVLALLGGAPQIATAQLVLTLLPLLEATFRREQARLVVEAQTEIARKSTQEAQNLIAALDSTRQALQDELRERTRAEKALREQVHLARLHMEVSTALTRGETLHELLQQCTSALVQYLDAAFARIWLLNEEEQVLELQASAGMYTHLDGEHARIPVGTLKIGLIARERTPLLSNAVVGDPRVADQDWARREGMVAFAGYPLLVDDHLVGVTELFARQPLSDAVLYALQSVASAIALGIERKQTETALRVSEERFRTLANQTPMMIWQSDTHGANIYVNTTWCTFTGLTLAESLGSGWMSALHPDDREAASILWRQSLVTRVQYQTQFRLCRADGVYRDVMVDSSTCFNPNGRFTGYIGILLDITEQKDLERQKEAFVSMATHELKTPLTALQGNIQLAERGLRRLQRQLNMLQPDQQKQLDTVFVLLTRSQKNLQVQNRLINDLLDISRMQEKALELRPANCDLVHLVNETVQDYQVAHPLRSITLEQPEQEMLTVHVDRDRIMQVLSNYLTNALKYSPTDTAIQVGITFEHTMARVWVADQGVGLSHEAQHRIWERFYRVPGVTMQSGTGVSLGLGLSICQGIISSHHGKVGVESTPGQGSRFWFTLPLV